MLEATRLTKKFGGLTAVSDFSFQLEPGQLLGLIGPNGAGKTTVFNLLSGVHKPTSGQIFLEGRDITGLAPHRLTAQGIVRTFQNVRLMKGVSLRENMRPAFHLRRLSGFWDSFRQSARYVRGERLIREQTEEMLALVGIADFQDVPAEDLPYGVQKRAELARALLFKPKILLLDEPAAGLNPQETGEIMGIIKRINEQERLAIILVEHNMKFVMGLSQWIVVMDQGRTIAEGGAEGVQTHPEVIKAYLGERAWKKQMRVDRTPGTC